MQVDLTITKEPEHPTAVAASTLADLVAQAEVVADEPRQSEGPLYLPRQKIYPQSVRGRYRNIKWAVLLVTLGIYYLLPFVRWDRGPGAPDQAVLIDLSGGVDEGSESVFHVGTRLTTPGFRLRGGSRGSRALALLQPALAAIRLRLPAGRLALPAAESP